MCSTWMIKTSNGSVFVCCGEPKIQGKCSPTYVLWAKVIPLPRYVTPNTQGFLQRCILHTHTLLHDNTKYFHRCQVKPLNPEEMLGQKINTLNHSTVRETNNGIVNKNIHVSSLQSTRILPPITSCCMIHDDVDTV